MLLMFNPMLLLRFCSVELPITIPSSMFDRELDYYGIETDEARVSGQGSIPDIMASFATPVIKAEKRLAEAKKRRDLCAVAYECYNQFCKVRMHIPEATSVEVSIGNGVAKYVKGNYDGGILDGNDKKLFDTYLEKYFGLVVSTRRVVRGRLIPVMDTVYLNGHTFEVCTKDHVPQEPDSDEGW